MSPSATSKVNRFVGYACRPTQGSTITPARRNNCIVLFLRGKPDYYHGSISHADKVRSPEIEEPWYLTATGPFSIPMKLDAVLQEGPALFMGNSLQQNLPGAGSQHLARTYSREIVKSPTAALYFQEQLNKAPSHALINRPTCIPPLKTTIQDGLLTNVVG